MIKIFFQILFLAYSTFFMQLKDLTSYINKMMHFNFVEFTIETSNFTKFTLITQLVFSLLLLLISLLCLLFFSFQRSIVNSLIYLILFLASLFFSLFFLGIDYISLLFLIVPMHLFGRFFPFCAESLERNFSTKICLTSEKGKMK